ncbi:OLC1v1035851C1 [Oldenlandia corymbosa var. corymbosa]|uniref:OLC1v1035851C1 n=1 Tax=Oldenlandia corymbosa var. corymbosa TaxID=529605 RepID=A0AAV1CUJ8_OLDCO|nr:OLC1v1035851C1 [Oldenlandia corymbosa var. corymbosa]
MDSSQLKDAAGNLEEISENQLLVSMQDDTNVDDDRFILNDGPDFRGLERFRTIVIGPCNGIVCLAEDCGFLVKALNVEENCIGGSIYLYNPATRESRKLPKRPFGCPQGLCCYRDCLGLGFDPCTNEYKIVSMVFFSYEDYDYSYGFYKVEIYCLSTNTWTQKDITLPSIDNPATPEDSLASVYLRRERSGYEEESCSIIIWMMKEYGVEESWVKRFCLGPFGGVPVPFTCWNDTKLIMGSDACTLSSCDLVEDGCQRRKLYSYGIVGAAIIQKECLVSLTQGLGEEAAS